MNKTTKIIIVVVLILIVGVVIALKESNKANSESKVSNSKETKALPRLVDLGADQCIPCKLMAPILEELKTEYQDKLGVVFIDVWKNPDEAKKYKINIIPTQIFYDTSGKELFRHEGFFSREDILGKWKEFGIDLEKGAENENN